jgi:hypothetical protein
MSVEGLDEIVREPLRLVGYGNSAEIDALIAQIEQDVSDRPGDLALVQMALFETWRRHEEFKQDLL